jgi:hypothetical protein
MTEHIPHAATQIVTTCPGCQAAFTRQQIAAARERLNLADRSEEELWTMLTDRPLDTYELAAVNEEFEFVAETRRAHERGEHDAEADVECHLCSEVYADAKEEDR